MDIKHLPPPAPRAASRPRPSPPLSPPQKLLLAKLYAIIQQEEFRVRKERDAILDAWRQSEYAVSLPEFLRQLNYNALQYRHGDRKVRPSLPDGATEWFFYDKEPDEVHALYPPFSHPMNVEIPSRFFFPSS